MQVRKKAATGVNIKETITEVFDKNVGDEMNCLYAVSDGGANMRLGVELFVGNKFENTGYCFAHCMQLVLKPAKGNEIALEVSMRPIFTPIHPTGILDGAH